MRKTRLLMLGIAVAMSVIIAANIFMTAYAKNNPQKIQVLASNALGKTVTFSSVNVTWRRLKPTLRFSRVLVKDEKEQPPLLQMDELQIAINVWKSLWHWQLTLGDIAVIGADLRLKQDSNGRLSMAEMPTTEQAFIIWLIARDKILFKNITLYWYDDHGLRFAPINVDMMFLNHRGRMRIKGMLSLAQVFESTLSIKANLAFSEKNQWEGDVYLQFADWQLSQWLEGKTRHGWQVTTGALSGEAWLTVSEDALPEVQALLDLTHVQLTQLDSSKVFFIQALQANLAWEKQEKGWQLMADALSLRQGGVTSLDSRLTVDYREDDGQHTLSAYLDYLDLAMVSSLFAQPGLIKKITGELFDATWLMQTQPNEQASWQLKADLQKIAWLGSERMPGISGLSGQLFLTPAHGTFMVASKGLVLRLPDHHQHLPLGQAAGLVEWQRQADRWLINTEQFVVDNPVFHSTLDANLTWFEPSSGISPVASLSGKFMVHEVMHAKHFVPKDWLSENVYQWMDNALLNGEFAAASLDYQGPLTFSALANGEGKLAVKGNVYGVMLHYYHDWPVLDRLHASFSVDNQAFNADIQSALLVNMPIDNLSVRMNFTGEKPFALSVGGAVKTDSSEFMLFLQQTPLLSEKNIANQFSLLGDIDLSLNLFLYDGDLTMKGKAQLTDNQWRLSQQGSLQLSDINGQFAFTEQGFQQTTFTLAYQGHPIEATLHPVSFEHSEPLLIDIHGKLSADLLPAAMRQTERPAFTGQSHYQGQIVIQSNKQKAHTLRLSSDLSGLLVHLPAPLSKPEAYSIKSQLNMAFSTDELEVKFNYGHRLSGILRYSTGEQGLFFDRGELRLDSHTALLPSQPGLTVVGSLSLFDPNDWLTWLSTPAENDEKHKRFIEQLTYVDLRIQQAALFGQSWEQVDVKVSREDDKWLARLNNEQMSGKIYFTEDKDKRVTAKFDYLSLPSEKPLRLAHRERTKATKPLPAIYLSIDNFSYGEKYLGKLSVETVGLEEGIKIETLSLRHPAHHLTAEGRWLSGDNTSLALKGKVVSKDVAQTLSSIGLHPTVGSNDAQMHFDLQWPLSSSASVFHGMNGTVHFHVGRGQILHLSEKAQEKIGLGKALSLLSLQTLPRRFSLDFSDLSDKGLSFDKFSGHFSLDHGNAYTNNTTLDGPVAYAKLVGNIDLAQRAYQLNIHVVPHVTSSLPVVATLLAGPIAGVATWAADRFVDFGMREMGGYTYHISGPWSDPVVSQVGSLE